MSLPALSDFRRSLDRCEVALLIDIDSRTCLLSASSLEPSQDQLDDLCCLGAACLGDVPDDPVGFVLVSRPIDIRIFVRVPGAQSEALCLILAPNAALHDVEARVNAFLKLSGLDVRIG